MKFIEIPGIINKNILFDNYSTIVIGTAQGRILFYDEGFKLLYWVDECNFDSIHSISFDLFSEFKAPKLFPDDKEGNSYQNLFPRINLKIIF